MTWCYQGYGRWNFLTTNNYLFCLFGMTLFFYQTEGFSLDLGQIYPPPPRHLMLTSMLSLKPCWKIYRNITSPSLVTTPNTLSWQSIFITLRTACADISGQRLFCEFTIWSWQKVFSSEKNQNMFGWSGCLCLFKNFATRSFFLFFIACDKNWPFLVLNERCWASSCTICLMRKSVTPMSLNIDLLTCWNRSQSWPRS